MVAVVVRLGLNRLLATKQNIVVPLLLCSPFQELPFKFNYHSFFKFSYAILTCGAPFIFRSPVFLAFFLFYIGVEVKLELSRARPLKTARSALSSVGIIGILRFSELKLRVPLRGNRGKANFVSASISTRRDAR